MGTSSLTIIKDENDCRVLGMRRHNDGYPSGHGFKLALWLQGIEIVYGISEGDKMGIQANGIGCLAAQTVCHFANTLGSIMLVSQEESSYQFPDSHKEPNYNYIYVVEFHKDQDFRNFPSMEDCYVTVYQEDSHIFSGSLKEFKAFCESQ